MKLYKLGLYTGHEQKHDKYDTSMFKFHVPVTKSLEPG